MQFEPLQRTSIFRHSCVICSINSPCLKTCSYRELQKKLCSPSIFFYSVVFYTSSCNAVSLFETIQCLCGPWCQRRSGKLPYSVANFKANDVDQSPQAPMRRRRFRDKQRQPSESTSSSQQFGVATLSLPSPTKNPPASCIRR